MKFVTILTFVLGVAAPAFAAGDPFAENVRTTDPLTPEQQQKTFKLPPGFEIQLVASEPNLRKPMNMAFDAQGHLWLTESREYPFPATNDSPRDTIRVFSDFDANGRAQKATVFATNLNIPIGILPYQDGCIAWSIPNIWFFRDTDGDGMADKKEKLLGPFDHTRDTHGNQASFRRGPDGWVINATHGFNNRSRVAGHDGAEVFLPSGNTYRFRPDGSRIEQWTHGQVNPFGLAFDPLGNLYSADCHSSPIYQLLRGAYYPSFGAPDDGLGFAPTTIQHSHGSTAIAGIVDISDPAWPAEFQSNILIGNVMTSRINRDRIEWRGTSSVGVEMPDFLSTTDPWFRPVDLQIGPDGALYISDFYNRIIGHYEVPLLHPGRDRERGRLWRVFYKGNGNKLLLMPNYPSAPVAEIVSDLGSPNQTRRTIAMNYLVDRVGTNAVKLVQAAVQGTNAFQRLHGLWVLQRLGALTPEMLAPFVQDPDRGVRVQVMRILAETDWWLPGSTRGEVAGLRDADPFVQRAATESIAQSQWPFIAPLLRSLREIPAADTHLSQATRIALRNQLQRDFREVAASPNSPPARWNFYDAVARGQTNLDERDSRAVADVSVAITNAVAASFLVTHLQKYAEPRAVTAKYLQHAARFLPEDRIDDLATLARDKFSDDVDLQSALFKSIQDGLAQRGAALSPRVTLWGSALADDLLSSVRRSESDWFFLPVDSNPTSANPWVVQNRPCADGQKADFFCSLPQGEQLTGIMRSKNFAAPAQLSFFIAGHDGFPDKPLQGRNLVRLRDADSFDVLMQAPAPRNDAARRVTWDLSKQAGQQVFLELVDGDTGGAFAWLAVGRFDPGVVTLPKVTPKLLDERLQAAAQIVLAIRDQSLEPALTTALKMPAGADARASVAKTLLAMNARQYIPICGGIMNDAGTPEALRQRIAQAVVESNSDEGRTLVIDALRRAPERAQPKFALALATTKPGAEALLKEVESGRVSARVVQNQNVKEKLNASKADEVKSRLAKLTQNLAPLNEQVQKLIDQRRAAFVPAQASATRGLAVYEKNCAACHQLDGKGALIGPQLDGLGARGAERIMEDILDPNRNVDGAFRTTTFLLNDGDVVSGLFRREEGELVIYAESTGKEVSVPKKSVKERRQSELSLMPDNFADAMPSNEFNDLIAFLLTKTGAKK